MTVVNRKLFEELLEDFGKLNTKFCAQALELQRLRDLLLTTRIEIIWLWRRNRKDRAGKYPTRGRVAGILKKTDQLLNPPKNGEDSVSGLSGKNYKGE